jgi:hypothetical protein
LKKDTYSSLVGNHAPETSDNVRVVRVGDVGAQ